MAIRSLFSMFTGNSEKKIPTIAAPSNDDGAVEQDVLDTSGIQGAWRSFGLTLDPSYQNLPEMINMYREIASFHEVENAITDICDQAIVLNEDPITINLDKTNFSSNIQKKIIEEFNTVLTLLDYRQRGYDRFRRWYVDGRIAWLKVVDEKNPGKGIQELRPLDSRYLIKARDIIKKNVDGEEIITGYNDYFIYKPQSDRDRFMYSAVSQKEYPIPLDAVVFSTSGLLDCSGKSVISYLHKAMKPANMLKMLEDAHLIYVIARAPERRVFYIDTGNLPKTKAESYVRGIMNGFKNKMVYDPTTGKVKNGYNAQSMLEDFWLPRREGSKGTEVTTLPGGANVEQTQLLDYYKSNLYDSLSIPRSRLDSASTFQFGTGTEITRDELKFDRFVRRLQQRFSTVFSESLKTQLILKKIITEDEWEDNFNDIFFNYASDSYFDELRNAEILQMRLSNYQNVAPIIGKYVSNEWVLRNVLHMSDEESRAQQKIIQEEKKNVLYQTTDEEM